MNKLFFNRFAVALAIIIALIVYIFKLISLSSLIFLAIASYYLWDRKPTDDSTIMKFIVFVILIFMMIMSNQGLIG